MKGCQEIREFKEPFTECPPECPLQTNRHDVRKFALRTARRGYGGLLVALSNPDLFGAYEPFAANTANLVALYIENQRHQAELNTLNRHLEDQVRVRTEELLASEKRYREMVEETADLITRVDASGRFIFVNHAARRFLGVEREECIGMLAFDFVHPGDRAETKAWLNSCVDGRIQQAACENRQVNRKTGAITPMLWTSRFHYARNGRLKMIDGIARDITERKQAEEALRNVNEKLTVTLSALPDLLFEVDRDGRIHDFRAPNPNLLYLPQEEFLGKSIFEILPEDAARVIEGAIADAAQTGLHRGAVYSLAMPGGLNWFELSIAAKGGRAPEAHFIVLARDITERKRAEEERLLLERQVQHAQKLESLGVLAGGIAHDFNNLLMAILGNADLALHELSPMSPARENILEIEKASRRAAELSKQMLAYSGKGRFVIEPIALGKLVEEMAHLLEVSISKKAVLKFNFAQNLPVFDGDATQIRQIIMNLITNASEAIGDKSGVIALSTGAMNCGRDYLDGVNEVMRASLGEPLPEGAYVYLEVADTGCGMNANTISKIFDPFFTTKFTGRGLGMSAMLGIVRGHHGAIKIYSEPGKGMTFKVLFPSRELPEGGQTARWGNRDETSDWCGNGTVLIADDEETVCAVGKQILERLGFDVLTAPDGQSAVDLFRQHENKIVCVLLDLTMPHLDGAQAFSEIRRIRQDATIVLCSGYGEQDATQRFSGKGLSGFLQKPYNMTALKDKLREVLPG